MAHVPHTRAGPPSGIGFSDLFSENEDGIEEEDNKLVHSDNPSIKTVDKESRVNNEQSTDPQEPAPSRPPAFRKLDSDLDSKHWKGGMVGLVIREHCVE